ncbi:FecCD family ABC transporter permease [Oceanospirillum linum]|uniref:Iron ABC transporter permease n=1 Tax=Oceanospirillum linum TaxID=966 RepID=A0A1T1HBW7_OCELI|nr:iron ABC transporter permease [Oceanospirillum linum]OOV87303.1 iron ABC transporter permease [Oceanospirillum linum]SEF80725.1 iron complex transport system permease protein [Oleiphilus messinensis]SMP18923.1 iron complex transport system permease protein [Oceanospirillum linum]
MLRLPPALTASVLFALLLLAALSSIMLGAMPLPALESLLTVIDAATGSAFSNLQSYQQAVVTELRLPRILLALAVGAILAQSGAVMQGLFRNPLADPGIIGVSSGAAVGAVIAIVWLPASISAWSVPVAAFISGLGATLLVYGLSQTRSGTSVLVLLLAGVALSAFAGAAIGFVSYFASDENLRALSLWQMGSLAGSDTHKILLASATFALLAYAFQKRAGALNALLLGEADARHLGINVERLKLELIVLTAVGVGVAVACSGIIGFVGLVVPHIVRMTTGPSHKTLLPLTALCGALLLLVADLFSRLAVQPAELPVGLVTALMGAPFFLFMLIQQRRRWNT